MLSRNIRWYPSAGRQGAPLDGVEVETVDRARGSLAQYVTSRDRDDLRETNLLRDVAFNRHSMQDGKHVSPYDNGKIQAGTDGIVVEMIQGLDEDQIRKVLSKATRATTGINIELPDDDTRDWEEMLSGGLQAAMEAFAVVFQVQGVSRACTHQLVRSRRAGFHQQSQRATFYGNQPEVRMPESVWRNPKAREAYIGAIAAAHRAYQVACEEDISYQDARYVLPEGTTNYILCEYTLREFLAVYAYRACSMFNWEIVHVVREMGRLLTEAHPWLAKYVKIGCQQIHGAKDDPGITSEEAAGMSVHIPVDSFKHTCTFQGWERVGGQCDFPWARDSNRTFRSKHHEIAKKEEK